MTDHVELDHTNLASFFYDAWEQATEASGRDFPPEIGAYVVDLLSRFARRTGVAGRKSPPLALQYMAARKESGSARARALRGVGDRALYIAGVVPRSLARSAVNRGYVCSIGEAAYRGVATNATLEVFDALAEAFGDVSNVIADVVENEDDEAPGLDLIALYERWRDHGDPRDARKLLRAGVLLDPSGSDVVQ